MKKTYKETFAFDRAAFKQLSPEEADKEMVDSTGTTWQERLRYSYYLTATAYGFDPDNPPKMDRSHFEIVKRDG